MLPEQYSADLTAGQNYFGDTFNPYIAAEDYDAAVDPGRERFGFVEGFAHEVFTNITDELKNEVGEDLGRVDEVLEDYRQKLQSKLEVEGGIGRGLSVEKVGLGVIAALQERRAAERNGDDPHEAFRSTASQFPLPGRGGPRSEWSAETREKLEKTYYGPTFDKRIFLEYLVEQASRGNPERRERIQQVSHKVLKEVTDSLRATVGDDESKVEEALDKLFDEAERDKNPYTIKRTLDDNGVTDPAQREWQADLMRLNALTRMAVLTRLKARRQLEKVPLDERPEFMAEVAFRLSVDNLIEEVARSEARQAPNYVPFDPVTLEMTAPAPETDSAEQDLILKALEEIIRTMGDEDIK